ncbi:hypothetical protein [Flavobacterium psychraquaticum]
MFHIEKINKLYPDVFSDDQHLVDSYNELSAKVFNFIKYVEEN